MRYYAIVFVDLFSLWFLVFMRSILCVIIGKQFDSVKALYKFLIIISSSNLLLLLNVYAITLLKFLNQYQSNRRLHSCQSKQTHP